jgi:hypothetical protein
MTDDHEKCPECGELGYEQAMWLGAHNGEGVATTHYYCDQDHHWLYRRPAYARLNPELQKQLWEAIRPDLCPFCRQPLDDGQELWSTVCHKECRDSERAIRGIV